MSTIQGLLEKRGSGLLDLSTRNQLLSIPVNSESARIFQRFYRSAGQSRATGSGLGLSIVAAIAEAHGGRAEVDSEVGFGSTFSILIPRSAP